MFFCAKHLILQFNFKQCINLKYYHITEIKILRWKLKSCDPTQPLIWGL